MEAFFTGSATTLIAYTLYKGDVKDYKFGLIGAAVFCTYTIFKQIKESYNKDMLRYKIQHEQSQYS